MKYKVLMHGHVMVDENLLSKGIYETDRPTLHLPDTTIISLTSKCNEAWNFATGKYISKGFIDNLNLCELIEFDLVKSELSQALEDYSALLRKEIGDLVGIASAHHWQSSNVEEGIRLRNLIQELKK